jgi:transcriptional regulator with XRE-family HTH domain
MSGAQEGSGVPEADVRVGAQLRRVRMQQDLSLHDVEARSDGEFKASVLGAYERGERSLSLTRLHLLADFFRVPVRELLPREPAVSDPDEGDAADERIVIDLVALEERRDDLPVLARYVEGLRSLRGDHAGRVLTVRANDLHTLAAARGTSTQALKDELSEVLSAR